MLTATHLRKQYSTVLAVDDVSLEVKRGEILGLLGPNGAGKTTTIRMILDIIRPDAGAIMIDGKSIDDSMRNSIGYLPEERGLYRKNKLLSTIVYFASLKGIDVSEAKRRAYDWLKRFDLLDYYQRKVEELSKGNQQKVQFIISILHDPALVILDEPFSGLDPINQILLKDILLELKQKGKAIIFSTHQMDQAEKLCDRICLINKGRVVLEGGLADVKSRYGKNTVQLEFGGDGAFLSSIPSVKKAHVYENFAELVLDEGCKPSEVVRALTPNIELRRFEVMEPSLNSIFLDAVGTTAPVGEQVQPSVTPKRDVINPTADKRVKKARQGVIMGLLVTILGIGVTIAQSRSSWAVPILFLLVTIISVVRYQRTLNTVKRELTQVSDQGKKDE